LFAIWFYLGFDQALKLNQNRGYEWDKGHATTQVKLGIHPPNYEGYATKLRLKETTQV